MFVAEVLASMPRKDQWAKGDRYLRGLMLDGRRKSTQAMAGRLPDGNERNLQQFVNHSTGDPAPVQWRIVGRMLSLINPEAWQIDDVSAPKDGRTSVGVARHSCGGLGRRANCQVAVSVHAVTDAASCPLQWRRFLPTEWASDPDRRAKTQVPADVGHREKWLLALGMLDPRAAWDMTPPPGPTHAYGPHSPTAAPQAPAKGPRRLTQGQLSHWQGTTSEEATWPK